MSEHVYLELFLVGLLLFREITSWRERKALLDRLMSRDFSEYAEGTKTIRTVRTPKYFPSDSVKI